jgi:hypothetical protein
MLGLQQHQRERRSPHSRRAPDHRDFMHCLGFPMKSSSCSATSFAARLMSPLMLSVDLQVAARVVLPMSAVWQVAAGPHAATLSGADVALVSHGRDDDLTLA